MRTRPAWDLSERWAETPALVQNLREWLWEQGLLQSKLVEGKNETDPDVAKFRDYFDYDEPIGRVPSHRALAVFRGRSLEILEAKLVLPEAPLVSEKSAQNKPLALDNQAQAATKTKAPAAVSLAEARIALQLGWSHQSRPADDLIDQPVHHNLPVRQRSETHPSQP